MKRYLSKDHLTNNLGQESPDMKYFVNADTAVYKFARRNPSGLLNSFGNYEKFVIKEEFKTEMKDESP